MHSLIVYLRNLNVFQPTADTVADEFEHRSNIIATRLYIILLVVSLFGLGLGIRLTLQTNEITLKYPTFNQVESLSINAKCPCSRLAFSYGTFVTLDASFHQICSSDFVSNRWIETIFLDWNTGLSSITGFRLTGSAQFQGLAGLCRLSQKNVQNSLDSFHSTSFISSKVLYRELLESTIQSLIEQFQLTIPITFQSQLNLINKVIYENSFLSGLQTSQTFTYWSADETDPGEIDIHDQNYYNNFGQYGLCTSSYDYRAPSEIDTEYDSSGNFTHNDEIPLIIPGFFIGCMPINSLLQSTLECFFNQSCVNTILSFFPTTDNFTAMSHVKESSFNLNSSVKSLIDRMMVEEWTQNISYEKYFVQCAPSSCVYSITQRHDFIFVLAQMIGLLGGMTLIFELIIPSAVRTVRNAVVRKNKTRPKMRLCARLNQFRTILTQKLIEFNLFKSHTQNDRRVHYQRIITRLYVLFVIVSSVIITLYFSLIVETHHSTAQSPTELQYNDLYNMYSDNLICPCTSLSTKYEMFVNIEPVYHQLCSSDFLSTDNINLLLSDPIIGMATTTNQAKLLLAFELQLLSTLCQYAQQTINDSRRVFLQTQFVSSQVIASEVFSSQSNQLIEDWKLNTIDGFQRVLQLIRATNEGNKLLNNGYNVQFQFPNTLGPMIVKPLEYTECSCALTQTCFTPTTAIAYSQNLAQGSTFRTVPYFNLGCQPLESMLQSTLECLYDEECIIAMQKPFVYNADDIYLNATLKITDPLSNETTETVESIVNRLMINSWLKNISFSSYYNSCAPSSCQFEYIGRRNIYTIITSTVSLIGGLSTLTKILVLIGIRLSEKITENRSHGHVIKFVRSLFSCHNEQQIARRLHVVLLLLTLIGFSLISYVPPETATVQLTSPSFSTYNDAFSHYHDAIECPCSKISFQHQTFLNIQPYFHEICSSDFMSNNWTTYVYQQTSPLGRFNSTDFRTTAVGQFQLLISFCQLSKQTVNDAILQLYKTDTLNTQLIPEDLFAEQIQTIVQTFQSNTPDIFLTILDLIREVTGANQLMSMYLTNWKFDDLDQNQADRLMSTSPLEYDGCNCGITSKCTQESRGMRAGCYPLEALLQSTLQCFYDQQCIDSNGTFQALNRSSMSTHFNINSSVESILEELMVEEYSINKSYEKYYAQCAPLSCSYSLTTHENIISIVTRVVELYGGLVIICGWITLLIIKLCRCRKNRVVCEPIYLS